MRLCILQELQERWALTTQVQKMSEALGTSQLFKPLKHHLHSYQMILTL